MLACPVCKGQLEFHEDRGEAWCLRCQLAWPIAKGVPDLTPGSSSPLRP
ncbi:Trm112 family protein [Hyalangium sp.]|nr:Trm112 family protein [Hyalangium sp.]HYH98139.1 Trm112 family protein [Hyalangium sp.]